MNTIERLTKTIRKAFDNDSIELTASTTANDIDEWDSFTYITLILEIEQEFGIEFNNKEIQNIANIGELIQRIEGKLSSGNR